MSAPTGRVCEQIRATAQTRLVAANGLRHRVLSFGDPMGRDVLLVPGITSPAETAQFLAAALPEHRMHVPDLRGRGGTEVTPSGSYTLEHYQADLTGLVAALRLGGTPVVGHSLGARIVAAWAVHERVRDVPLVLVDPPTSGPGREPYPMSEQSFLNQLEQARRGTDADEVRGFFPRWPERELVLRAEVLAGCDPVAVRETHRGFESEDFLALWDRLPPTATLIRGEHSPVVPPAAARELAARNPAIPVISVPDAGHMVPWDNLAGFVAELRRALDRHHREPEGR